MTFIGQLREPGRLPVPSGDAYLRGKLVLLILHAKGTLIGGVGFGDIKPSENEDKFVIVLHQEC